MKHLSEHVGVNELPVEFLGTTWNEIEPIIAKILLDNLLGYLNASYLETRELGCYNKQDLRSSF